MTNKARCTFDATNTNDLKDLFRILPREVKMISRPLNGGDGEMDCFDKYGTKICTTNLIAIEWNGMDSVERATILEPGMLVWVRDRESEQWMLGELVEIDDKHSYQFLTKVASLVTHYKYCRPVKSSEIQLADDD